MNGITTRVAICIAFAVPSLVGCGSGSEDSTPPIEERIITGFNSADEDNVRREWNCETRFTEGDPEVVESFRLDIHRDGTADYFSGELRADGFRWRVTSSDSIRLEVPGRAVPLDITAVVFSSTFTVTDQSFTGSVPSAYYGTTDFDFRIDCSRRLGVPRLGGEEPTDSNPGPALTELEERLLTGRTIVRSNAWACAFDDLGRERQFVDEIDFLIDRTGLDGVRFFEYVATGPDSIAVGRTGSTTGYAIDGIAFSDGEFPDARFVARLVGDYFDVGTNEEYTLDCTRDAPAQF